MGIVYTFTLHTITGVGIEKNSTCGYVWIYIFNCAVKHTMMATRFIRKMEQKNVCDTISNFIAPISTNYETFFFWSYYTHASIAGWWVFFKKKQFKKIANRMCILFTYN